MTLDTALRDRARLHLVKLVCWFGPVSKPQIAPSIPNGVELRVFGCTGDGKNGNRKCPDEADRWKDEHGRYLPRTLHALGADDKIAPWLAAFSAGGQIVKRVLAHEADRAQVAGVYLADATYTATWSIPGLAAALDPPLEALVRYALDAVKDGRWLVATASGYANVPRPGLIYPSGSQTLGVIWKALEERLGEPLADASHDALLEGLRAPVRAGRHRNVLLIDFGQVYKHGDHATEIAALLLPRLIGDLGSRVTNAPAAGPAAAVPRSPASSAAPSSSPGAGFWARLIETERHAEAEIGRVLHALAVAAARFFGPGLVSDVSQQKSAPLPPGTAQTATRGVRVLLTADVDRLFGPLKWTPVPGDESAVTLDPAWEAANLVHVEIPQLRGKKGAPADGRVRFHRLVAPRVAELFAAWERAKLLDRVLSWDGSFAARRTRGRQSLSRHAYGIAFDINAAQNPLGAPPSPAGTPGSTAELEPIAAELGFVTGRAWSRPDPMHFEAVR